MPAAPAPWRHRLRPRACDLKIFMEIVHRGVDILTCTRCGQNFEPRATNQLYCSKKCSRIAKDRRHGIQPMRLRSWEPGKRFGRLVLDHRIPSISSKRQIWACRCDCGNMVEARADKLASGTQQGCGCLRKEILALALKNREQKQAEQSSELQARRLKTSAEQEQFKRDIVIRDVANKHRAVCTWLSINKTPKTDPLWQPVYYAALIQNGCHYCNKALESSGTSLVETNPDKSDGILTADSVVPSCETCASRRFVMGSERRKETLTHEEMEILGQTIELIHLRRNDRV